MVAISNLGIAYQPHIRAIVSLAKCISAFSSSFQKDYTLPLLFCAIWSDQLYGYTAYSAVELSAFLKICLPINAFACALLKCVREGYHCSRSSGKVEWRISQVTRSNGSDSRVQLCGTMLWTLNCSEIFVYFASSYDNTIRTIRRRNCYYLRQLLSLWQAQ